LRGEGSEVVDIGDGECEVAVEYGEGLSQEEERVDGREAREGKGLPKR
jgi:hypothetical protein